MVTTKLEIFYLENDITQVELAEKLNISQSLLSLILSGKKKSVSKKVEYRIEKFLASQSSSELEKEEVKA